jgi:hypothetical protein
MPLAGIRIVELGHRLAAAVAALRLADGVRAEAPSPLPDAPVVSAVNPGTGRPSLALGRPAGRSARGRQILRPIAPRPCRAAR